MVARLGASKVRITSSKQAGLIFQMGVAPRRIDILTAIEGVDFEAAWQDRLIVEIEGLSVPVISKQDLVTNKRAVGRPQDLADVKRLDRSEPA